MEKLDDFNLECCTGNNLKDFLNILKSYPIGNQESNLQLLKLYRSGDETAKDLLIKTNLRLVVSEAYKVQNSTHSYELLDLIQEGSLGLIRSIEYYDENRGDSKFSTFATVFIKNSIREAILNNDKEIRRPQHVNSAVRNYKKIVETCSAAQKEIPNDEELCTQLDITKKMLNFVKQDYQLDTCSLNTKIREDDDDSELEDVVCAQENEYENLLNKLTDQSLMATLKLSLPPFHYYVLYNHVFSDEKKRQHEISEEFCLTKQAISRVARKCLDDLKKLILKNGSISDWNLKPEFQDHIEEISVEPINHERIVQYLFFRDILDDQERELFKLLVTSIYKPNEERFAKELGIDIVRYRELSQSLQRKIKLENDELKEVYECFKKEIMNKYGSKIFKVDLDTKLEDVVTNIQFVAKLWSRVSYHQVTEIINASDVKISHHMQKLLFRYFDGNKYSNCNVTIEKAEREVNEILFGYSKKCELPLNGLYEVLEKNKDAFTEEQYMRLLRDKFHKISKKEYVTRFPNDTSDDTRYLYHRLEELYFNVHNYRDFHFTSEKYRTVRDQFVKKEASERVAILDRYYGIDYPKHTVQQIADEWKISYDEARVKIREARKLALSIYLDRSRSKNIEESNYIPYILDDSIDLSDISREMLKQFLIEKKSYDVIAKIHGTTTRKVSVNITTGLMKIDYYRFGIFKSETRYTSDEINFAFSKASLTPEEKGVIQMKMAGKSRKEMMEQTGLDFQRIAYILNKFSKICCSNRVKKVEIQEQDLLKEVTCHLSERVLNETERLFLSELYGLKCDLNPDGKKYTEQEFRTRHSQFSKTYKKVLNAALETVRAKKAGQIRASLAYMEREELRKSLKDPRIPIDEKDRELLNYCFELNGYPYKTLNELEKLFDSQAYSLKLRIQRAFVTIFKYENYEIPPMISFEYDVAPYLRYFSKSDQKILEDLYQEKLTYKEIASKNGLTESQVEHLVLKLDDHLHDLIDEKVNGFDFDYFWKVIDEKDVPFYGDKEKAKRIFYLYYEQRMTIPEIIETLKLDCSASVVSRTISHLMLSVLKRREGIKKVKTYSYDEIKDYYLENEKFMDLEHQEIYKRYFACIQKEKEESSLNVLTYPNIPSSILLDLLKEKHENLFSIEKSSKEEALEIIRKYESQLSSVTLNALYKVYDISQRELMSGSEQAKVLRFLSNLEQKEKIMVLKKVA